MLDNLNVLGRIDAWIAMLRYGAGVELRWSGTGAPVIRLMRRYGIRTYAPGMPNRNERTIRVPAQQGKWAEYLCKRAGIPLTGPLIDQHNANVQPGPLPPAWGIPARGVGMFGVMSALLAPLGSWERKGKGRARP